ncbi:hypothetical protein ACXZ65_02855 [Streptomyces aculeolatus]
MPAADLRPLLDGVERDLAGFLALATGWAGEQLADHAAPAAAALARVLAHPAR